jgi:hypothetical protein
MKAQRRHWSAEQHRRYLETLGNCLPSIIASTAKPITGIGVVVAAITGKLDSLLEYLSRW